MLQPHIVAAIREILVELSVFVDPHEPPDEVDASEIIGL